MTRTSDWISGKQAAAILTTNSGHDVNQAYVRRLALQGKIRQRPIDGRTNEYNRSDVMRYKVAERNKREAKEVEPEAIPA